MRRAAVGSGLAWGVIRCQSARPDVKMFSREKGLDEKGSTQGSADWCTAP